VRDAFTMVGMPTVRARIDIDGDGASSTRAYGTWGPTASRRCYYRLLDDQQGERRFSRPGLLSARATRSGYRSSTLRVRVMH
jgi:hypothetical protein